MNERKVAIQAMRKIIYRDRSVLMEDAVNDKDKTALVNLGLCEWHIGTDIDGSPSPYLMLTDAGIIAHEFALGEKRWRRKWEIAQEITEGYRQITDNLREKIKQLRKPSVKMSIGSIEYEVEVTETDGRR